VSDVGVQLGPAVGVARGPVLVELRAALVAEPRPQVVLAAAARAAVGQLAAGHGHERPLGALDDLQVADDEGVAEGDRAEGLEPLVLVPVFHELDADFGDNHGSSPLRLWHPGGGTPVRPHRQLRTMNTRGPGPSPGPVRSPRATRKASPWSRHRANRLLPLPL